MSVLNLSIENAINNSIKEVGGIVEQTIKKQDYDYNLIDMSKLKYNKHFNANGTITDFNGNILTDYIEVSNYVSPTINLLLRVGGIGYDVVNGCYFFDAKKNLISTYNYDSTPSVSVSNIEIPDGAVYMVVEGTYNTSAPLRFWMIAKYGCYPISWFDVKAYQEPDTSNLINFDNLIEDFRINASGVIGIADGNKCTPLIPVLPGKKYYTTWMHQEGAYNKYMFMYDGNKNFIGYKDDFAPIWTAPINCYYVAFDVTDVTDKAYGIFPKDKWDGNIGEVVTDNDKVVASVTNGMPPSNGCYIIGVYENHLAIQRNQNNTEIYYSSNGWDGPFTSIDIADIEGYDLYDHPQQVVFFNTNNGIRCLIFVANTPNIGDIGAGKIFCSTTGAFSGFELADIWDLKGSHHWRVADDDKDPTGQRYRKYYPTEDVRRQNRFMWHNGPIWFDGIGGQYSRGLAFANYTNNYVNKSEPSCLFYTEDGKNIYVQYEFGVYQKYYKKAGDNTVRQSVNYNLGDDLDCTTFSGTYSFSLKRRYNILPSSTEKDPTNIFEYGEAVSVSSISGKNLTIANAAGLNVGDTIILTGTGTGDYAKLLNNEASETEGGQTAFVIKSISGNVITLADVIGNVHNNLSCRHIHGVAEFGQGLCIYTGEEYPESWFIYLCPNMNSASDGVNVNDNRWENSVVRLNAGENAFQRALGVYLRPDGKVVYIADSNAPYNKKLEVRGKELKMGAYGIHIFELSDIDNTEGSLSKIQALNAGYALYFIAGVLFFSDYNEKTYYSTDNGDTWNFVCKAGGLKNRIIGFDRGRRRFYFNVTRNEQFVIELK